MIACLSTCSKKGNTGQLTISQKMEKVFGVFMGASENLFQATAKVCRSREKREKKLQRLAILSNFHSSPLLFNGLQARFLLLLKDTPKKKKKKKPLLQAILRSR